MTSSINEVIREGIKKKKVEEKLRQENAEKLLQDIQILEEDEIVAKPKPKTKTKPKAKAKAKKTTVKKSATEKGKK